MGDDEKMKEKPAGERRRFKRVDVSFWVESVVRKQSVGNTGGVFLKHRLLRLILGGYRS